MFQGEILTIIVVSNASVSPLEHSLVLFHSDGNANWSTSSQLVDERVGLKRIVYKTNGLFSNSSLFSRIYIVKMHVSKSLHLDCE